MRLVCERYELGWPLPDEVKRIDKRMAVTEAQQLLHPNAYARLRHTLTGRPLALSIEPWSAARSRREFAAAARALGLAD